MKSFLKYISLGHAKLAYLLNLVLAEKARVECLGLALSLKKFAGSKILENILSLEDATRSWCQLSPADALVLALPRGWDETCSGPSKLPTGTDPDSACIHAAASPATTCVFPSEAEVNNWTS